MGELVLCWGIYDKWTGLVNLRDPLFQGFANWGPSLQKAGQDCTRVQKEAPVVDNTGYTLKLRPPWTSMGEIKAYTVDSKLKKPRKATVLLAVWGNH